jgi:AmmeMemoRadiSam system protein B
MNLRKRSLSPGWYPQTAEKIALFLENIPELPGPGDAVAAIAPHAGWTYSGALAARAVRSLKTGADTVIVIGGHLPRGVPPLFAEEEGVATPLGDFEIDREFRDLLWKELGGRADRYQDNTVEVQLPLVKYYFPQARLIWLRLPGEIRSFEAGRVIAGIGASLKRRFVALGSTDLTHYGDAYDFSPHGSGPSALEWMKTVNDAAFIRAVCSGDGGDVLLRAERDRSACSVGAVLACMGCAQTLAAENAELLAYATSAATSADTSAEISGNGFSGAPPGAGDASGTVADSFVGYAAMAFRVSSS